METMKSKNKEMGEDRMTEKKVNYVQKKGDDCAENGGDNKLLPRIFPVLILGATQYLCY